MKFDVIISSITLLTSRYLRLQVPEVEETMESSKHRHAVMKTLPKPLCRKDVINILGDQSDKEYPIFRVSAVKTVAVGKIIIDYYKVKSQFSRARKRRIGKEIKEHR